MSCTCNHNYCDFIYATVLLSLENSFLVVLNIPFHLLLSQFLGAELLSHRIELEIELNSVGLYICVFIMFFLFLLNVFFDNFQLVYNTFWSHSPPLFFNTSYPALQTSLLLKNPPSRFISFTLILFLFCSVLSSPRAFHVSIGVELSSGAWRIIFQWSGHWWQWLPNPSCCQHSVVLQARAPAHPPSSMPKCWQVQYLQAQCK